MALPAWPVANIPSSPLVGTFQISRTTEAPIVSEMNSGTTRRRRKVSLRVAPISFELLMTNAQAAIFKEFHETTLGDGAARFTMPILFMGQYRTQDTVFAEPPTYEHITQTHVKVGVSLLVENLGGGPLVTIPDQNALLLPDGGSFFLLP